MSGRAVESPAPPDRPADPDPARGWLAAAVWGLPALAAVIVFANTLSNELIYDDRWTSKRIPPFSLASVWNQLQGSRGLTYALHSLDKLVWGAWSPGFHVTNVLLHAAASALAARLALVLTSSGRVALLCGLLFAVHPVHTEVVASFSYRKDSLAMVFVLLAAILWLGRGRPFLRYAGSLACLALGLLSKEVAAVGVVPMLFLADLLPGHGHPAVWRERMKRAALRSAPLVALGVLAGAWILTNYSSDSFRSSIEHESNGLLTSYRAILATTVGAVPDLGRLLVLPVALSADHPIHPRPGFGDPRVSIGFLLLGGWILGTLELLRRAPVASFAAAWPLLTYLPCSNVFPLTHFFVAERYLYVPSYGVCLLLALLLHRALVLAKQRRRPWLGRAVMASAVLLVAAGGARSAARNRDWRDDRSLWSASLRAGVETDRVRGNLGVALLGLGQPEESIGHFTRALELHPCTKWRLPLAGALHRVGRSDEAADQCRTILETQPGNQQALELLRQISRPPR